MSADIEKTGRHGAPKYQESEEHARAGYETLDAQAGATYRAGVYILGTMFLVAALLVPVYGYLVRREARAQPPPATRIQATPAPTPGTFPRLVVSEPAVLGEHRRNEDEILNGWGWVEKDRGIARMPVEEAMRIVGERGALPTFPSAAPSAPAPAPEGAAAPAGAAGAPGSTPPAGTRPSAPPTGGRP